MATAARSIRRLLDVVLVIFVFAVIAIVLAATAGPALGHRLVIVRTESMDAQCRGGRAARADDGSLPPNTAWRGSASRSG